MASGGDDKERDKVAGDLDQFLRDRSNMKVDGIVSRSHERAKTERKHSADADDLSRREKERKLERMLQRQRRKRRSRLTVTDVRVEAAKILEEFLQSQLLEQSVQTKHDHRYQRFMEMRISEETTQSGDSAGHFASHSTIEREDSIPFADDSEAELKKAGSFPNDDMLLTYTSRNKPGVEIIHGKSKSVPYKGSDETALPRVSSKSGLKPPPPPPPGTPFSPSDGSGSKESLSYVPYTGPVSDRGVHYSSGSLDLHNSQGYSKSQEHITNNLVQPFSNEPDNSHVKPWASSSVINHSKIPQAKAPNSLDLPSNYSSSGSMTLHPGLKSGSPTKSVSPRRRKSGSDSEIDSDSDPDSHVKDRKKKPLYKRAQERIQLFIGKHKDNSPEDEDAFTSKPPLSKKREKKKRKKHAKLPLDDADCIDRDDKQGTVLEDRYIHSNRHIHQTHSGHDNGVVIRTEESTEITDIISDSEKKHIEKRLKVKESAEGGKGFFGRIRRMTSREKGKKKIKGSKSTEFHERSKKNKSSVQYGRGLSVPDPTIDNENDINVTYMERKNEGPGHSTVKARQVVEHKDDIKRHSSHLDIVDHDGALLERVYFDPEENDLPRNKSFDLIENVRVHETDVLQNGRVQIIRDVNRHDHMVISDGEVGATGDAGTDGAKFEDLTEVEKEDLYGKIAGRLAMIGDNIMTERDETHTNSSASPKSKSSPGDQPVQDEEVKKANLSQLEAEIRDELRLVADEIDARLELAASKEKAYRVNVEIKLDLPRLAASAKQAAMRIAGVVAYDQFSQVVDEQVNNEVGWAQIAALFNITKRAVQIAGASGSIAMEIKEMSLKYIEDKFASWIVRQGGWDSMLSETDTDSDSELD